MNLALGYSWSMCICTCVYVCAFVFSASASMLPGSFERSELTKSDSLMDGIGAVMQVTHFWEVTVLE